MPGIWQWVSQFTTGDIDIEEIFTTIGLDWKKKLDLLKAHGLHTLRLTDEQKQEFDTLFSALFTRSGIANGNEMYSFVARLGVNHMPYHGGSGCIACARKRTAPINSRHLRPLS